MSQAGNALFYWISLSFLIYVLYANLWDAAYVVILSAALLSIVEISFVGHINGFTRISYEPEQYKQAVDFMMDVNRGSDDPSAGMRTAIITLGIVLIGVSIFWSVLYLPLAIFFLLRGHSLLLKASLPPVLIVLGASKAGTENIGVKLQKQLAGHRVVHLLEDNDVLKPNWYSLSSVRSRSGEGWQSIVKSLMKISKMVVVDTRETTEAVSEELLMIEDENLYFKTLFLSEQNSYSVELPSGKMERTYTLKDLTETVNKITWTTRVWPSADRDIHAVMDLHIGKNYRRSSEVKSVFNKIRWVSRIQTAILFALIILPATYFALKANTERLEIEQPNITETNNFEPRKSVTAKL